MSNPEPKLLKHSDLVALLIKEFGIHDGIWTLAVELQFGALTAGADEQSLYPTGLVSVKSIGLSPGSKENNISIDASRVNPKPKKAKTKATKQPA